MSPLDPEIARQLRRFSDRLDELEQMSPGPTLVAGMCALTVSTSVRRTPAGSMRCGRG